LKIKSTEERNVEKRKNLNPIRATIQQTSTGKLVLHLSVDKYDLEDLVLQEGKQPNGIFDSIIIYGR